MLKEINVMLDNGAFLPTRAHEDDAGLDIYSPVKECVWRGESVTIDTGVHVQIPKGYVGMLKSKSGLNCKHGIIGEGVIDSGYSGSIVCKLYNFNTDSRNYHIEKGDKIIQLVIVPIETPAVNVVYDLWDSDRGSNGFGSTGR